MFSSFLQTRGTQRGRLFVPTAVANQPESIDDGNNNNGAGKVVQMRRRGEKNRNAKTRPSAIKQCQF